MDLINSQRRARIEGEIVIRTWSNSQSPDISNPKIIIFALATIAATSRLCLNAPPSPNNLPIPGSTTATSGVHDKKVSYGLELGQIHNLRQKNIFTHAAIPSISRLGICSSPSPQTTFLSPDSTTVASGGCALV
jgi:hypothetical protein